MAFIFSWPVKVRGMIVLVLNIVPCSGKARKCMGEKGNSGLSRKLTSVVMW